MTEKDESANCGHQKPRAQKARNVHQNKGKKKGGEQHRRQVRHDNSIIRILKMANGQAQARQEKKADLSCASFIKRGQSRPGTSCPFANLSQDDQSSGPKCQPTSTEIRDSDMIAQDEGGGKLPAGCQNGERETLSTVRQQDLPKQSNSQHTT